jgi:hypothetical protein
MKNLMTRILSLLLLLSLAGLTEVASAMMAPQSTTTEQAQQTSGDIQNTPAQTPDADRNGKALPDSPSAAQVNQNQAAAQDSDQTSQEPRGTAAAQAAKTHGGAASKPAGAAIAPAKQRRTRSLLIKLGIIAGAGAALGTVYGLSKGSPSRPPGAR